MMKPCVVSIRSLLNSVTGKDYVSVRFGSVPSPWRGVGHIDSALQYEAYSANFHGKKWVSGACTGHPGWARVTESLRVSGNLLQAYIAQLFLTTRPLLITEFPPGPLRKHVWLFFLLTWDQIQTESKNDTEALRPLVGKRRGGKWEREKFYRKCWHAPVVWHLKSWPKSCSNLKKTSNVFTKGDKADGPEHTLVPPEEHSRRFLLWISMTEEFHSYRQLSPNKCVC